MCFRFQLQKNLHARIWLQIIYSQGWFDIQNYYSNDQSENFRLRTLVIRQASNYTHSWSDVRIWIIN